MFLFRAAKHYGHCIAHDRTHILTQEFNEYHAQIHHQYVPHIFLLTLTFNTKYKLNKSSCIFIREKRRKQNKLQKKYSYLWPIAFAFPLLIFFEPCVFAIRPFETFFFTKKSSNKIESFVEIPRVHCCK